MTTAERKALNKWPLQPSAVAPVSLKELAAYLGLSQTTVSRVINETPAAKRIPESTQKRIMDAASLLKYKANVYARGLRSKRSYTVGVIVPEISEGYSTTVLSGIEDVLLREGFFYFVVSHRHQDNLLEGYPRLLLSRAVEGIIAVDTLLKDELPVPTVAVSGHRHHEQVINIQLDHAKAAKLAMEHLHALGHRNIAFIKGQAFSSDTKPRWNAICAIVSRLGIAMDPQLTVQLIGMSPGIKPGYLATQELLRKSRLFSAIFAFNDLAAIGAIVALREAHIRVPQEVSVVGFDDILSASTNDPALTTIRQPLRQMGEIAASTLLSMISMNSSAKKTIRMHPSLVIRQSTFNAKGTRNFHNP